MDLQRFCVKFFARDGSDVDEARFTEVFHDWIRRKPIPGILVDVADYRHVSNGPGIMLIGHEANIAMDRAGGRFGLLYQRKIAQEGALLERILAAVATALQACHGLEQEPRLDGNLVFEAGGFEFVSNDRLLAPNEPTAAAELSGPLASAAECLYPEGASIKRVSDEPGERLRFSVSAAASTDIGTVLARSR